MSDDAQNGPSGARDQTGEGRDRVDETGNGDRFEEGQDRSDKAREQPHKVYDLLGEGPGQPVGVYDWPEQWPVETSKTVFDGKVISVRRDIVRSPVDGTTFPRDVVVHPGAVAIVALDEDDRVLVVSQYRHPAGHRLTELPAGLRDVDGEPPWRAAQRELYEEGHVRASDWRVLTDVFVSPGMTDEAVRVYLARGITEVAADERFNGVDEEADMPTSWVPIAELVRAALSGQVQNALLCTGVLAAWAASHDGGFDRLRALDAPWPAVDHARQV